MQSAIERVSRQKNVCEARILRLRGLPTIRCAQSIAPAALMRRLIDFSINLSTRRRSAVNAENSHSEWYAADHSALLPSDCRWLRKKIVSVQ